MEADDNGWLVGTLAPWDAGEVWSLFSPDDDARMVWSKTQLFGVSVRVTPPKRYPRGAAPIADRADVEVTHRRSGEVLGTVEVSTMPIDRARPMLVVARAAAAMMGGAGFDVLIERTRRLWQVRPGGDVVGLVVAGIIAAEWQAPILAAGLDRLFGIKGAREELARRGYET